VDTRQWTHILTLLGVAVIVDDRVYKEEVDMFVEQAWALKEVITPDMLFSEKMAFDWFVVHRERHILALGESPFCKDILNAIYAIATVDGEYHPSEADVIGMACKHWNLSVPNNV